MYDYDFLAAAITDIMGDLEPGDSSSHTYLAPLKARSAPASVLHPRQCYLAGEHRDQKREVMNTRAAK